MALGVFTPERLLSKALKDITSMVQNKIRNRMLSTRPNNFFES